MNIAIIGAGPAGNYAAYFFAKSGHSVDIFEEHAQVGLPIQCTGLLTADFDDFQLPKETYLVNTFSAIEVNSPEHQMVIPQKEYLVCRRRFDSYLAKIAVDAGARLHLQHTFVHRNEKGIIIKDLKEKKEIEIVADLVIAADGPLSKTAHAYGFFALERKNYFGIQATVTGNFDPQRYITYFGTEVCPDLFAWVVPESSTTARVGLAGLGNTRHYFDKFMQKHNYNAVEMQAGTIPLFYPRQELHKDNCYVIGDAAGYVKATTLGGIIPAMKQAAILVDCINTGKDFEKEVVPLKHRMQMHLSVKKVLDKFSDKDWNRLVGLMGQKRITNVLHQHSRENPLPILVKTLLLEPRFLYFGRYLV